MILWLIIVLKINISVIPLYERQYLIASILRSWSQIARVELDY